MRAALLRAYRNTRYEVAGVTVRIGRRSPAMDRLLRAHGARQAVFITAHNPFSRRMPFGWNQRMQRHLYDAMRRRTLLRASGRWRGWAEDHLLVFGPPRPVFRLGRMFRQNSVVLVGLGRPARLRGLHAALTPVR